MALLYQRLLDWKTVQQKKSTLITRLKFGLDNMLLKPRGISRITGKAKLLSNHEVEITDGDEVSVVTAENIIIATGSEPAIIPAFNIDGKRIITSDEALDLMEIPKEMLIVGQVPWGSIPISIFDPGCRGDHCEMMSHVVPSVQDDEFARVIANYLEKKGIVLKCGSAIEK